MKCEKLEEMVELLNKQNKNLSKNCQEVTQMLNELKVLNEGIGKEKEILERESSKAKIEYLNKESGLRLKVSELETLKNLREKENKSLQKQLMLLNEKTLESDAKIYQLSEELNSRTMEGQSDNFSNAIINKD